MHPDPSTDIAQKVVVSIITEAFKAAMGTFRDAVDWFKTQNEWKTVTTQCGFLG